MSTFKDLYHNTKEDGEQEKRLKNESLEERALKREIQQKYDQYEAVIDAATMDINSMVTLKSYDLDVKIQKTISIERAEKVREQIAVEYKELFGEDIAKK